MAADEAAVVEEAVAAAVLVVVAADALHHWAVAVRDLRRDLRRGPVQASAAHRPALVPARARSPAPEQEPVRVLAPALAPAPVRSRAREPGLAAVPLPAI